MKLKNQVIKQFALNDALKTKNELYGNYVEHDPSLTCYIMVDTTDIVICNEEYLERYKDARFVVFGVANDDVELKEIISRAEVS